MATAERGDYPHVPVLADEVVDVLDPAPGDVVFDGTVATGGHSSLLLGPIQPGGILIGTDRDRDVLPFARRRLGEIGGAFHLVWATLSEIPDVLDRFGLAGRVAAALFDVGVSSLQLDRTSRGFSFDRDGPLDLRMGRGADRSAADLVAKLGEAQLEQIFREYGEEPRAAEVAREIVRERSRRPILRTRHLAEIVERVSPRRSARIHPATRVFQALRIECNHELDELRLGIEAMLEQGLAPGGRLAVLSFHSLEDRIVKNAFRDAVRSGRFEAVVKGAIGPSTQERRRNRRSRSAKLRVVAKKKE